MTSAARRLAVQRLMFWSSLVSFVSSCALMVRHQELPVAYSASAPRPSISRQSCFLATGHNTPHLFCMRREEALREFL